jgi:hypothetical protein
VPRLSQRRRALCRAPAPAPAPRAVRVHAPARAQDPVLAVGGTGGTRPTATATAHTCTPASARPRLLPRPPCLRWWRYEWTESSCCSINRVSLSLCLIVAWAMTPAT